MNKQREIWMTGDQAFLEYKNGKEIWPIHPKLYVSKFHTFEQWIKYHNIKLIDSAFDKDKSDE